MRRAFREFQRILPVCLHGIPGLRLHFQPHGAAQLAPSPAAGGSEYQNRSVLKLRAGALILGALAITLGLFNISGCAGGFEGGRPVVAPAILSQPIGQTVTVGQTASFSVSASGTGPLVYQWYKNGVAIGGATSSTYTTPATVVGDNGAVFTVTVTNAG